MSLENIPSSVQFNSGPKMTFLNDNDSEGFMGVRLELNDVVIGEFKVTNIEANKLVHLLPSMINVISSMKQ